MTTCGAVGALMVGGRVVGQLRCDREAGHDTTAHAEKCEACRKHRAVLEWAPEADPDLDLFDPDEKFDAEVPFGRIDNDDDFGL